MSAPLVLTVGHSSRELGELLELLREHAVRALVDVRLRPGSRRHPHFGRGPLAAAAARAGVEYVHEPELGGHRLPAPDSPNGAWSEPALRGYADRTAHPAFAGAVRRVLERAARARTCLMCAEAAPERCHRQILADVLLTHGAEVLHVVAPGVARPHALHGRARVAGPGCVTYPGASAVQPELFP